ncbi:MAG: ComEC/Rec2 family competence protein [Leptospiraceae bacterium]|nr:ComEC/Rec2 family competence protein [Leptospiraceae bacterium]MCP5494306.1 ComEC/Rec2 family competence protein [Leptospiraceae bacterium]
MRGFYLQFLPIGYFSYFAIGVLVGERYFSLVTPSLWLDVVFVIMIVVFQWKNKKVFWILLGFLAFSFLFWYGRAYPTIHVTALSQKNLNEYQEKNLTIILTPQNEIKKGYILYKVETDGITHHLILKDYHKKKYTFPVLKCRAKDLKIKTIRNDLGGFFGFLQEYENYYITVHFPKCLTPASIQDKRRFLRFQVEKLLENGGLEGTPKDIAMGLIFGDSGYLTSEFKTKAREAGILHLFAASGLHLGIILFFLSYISEKIPFFNYYASKVFPLSIAFFYIYILSFPVSLTRAYLFAFLFVMASLFFRKVKAIDLVVITSMFICIFDRENYLTLSFNLSFSAVCGILFLKSYLDKTIFPRWKNLLTENLTLSFSASLGTFPVLMFYFHAYSYGSILINLVLVPLTSLLLPFLYVSVFFEFIGFVYIKDLLWVFTDLLLRIQAFLSIWLGERLGFYKEANEKYELLLSCYVFLLILVFILITLCLWINQKEEKDKDGKRQLLGFILLFLLIGFFCLCYQIGIENQSQPSSVYAASDYYFVKSKNEIYIGGDCSFSRYKLNQIVDQVCDEAVQSVQTEKDGCFSFALDCIRKADTNSLYYTDKDTIQWKSFYPKIRFVYLTKKRKFQLENGKNIVFYYPGFDPIYKMIQTLKEKQGKIVLMIPPWSIHKPEEWNSVKIQLGIRKGWTFIYPNEL